MSCDFSPIELRQNELNDEMQFVHEIITDLVDCSREATHSLYKYNENNGMFENDHGTEWDGPSDEVLASKAWKIVAMLNRRG